MKRYLCILLSVLLSLSAVCGAAADNGGVFLSLTKRNESMKDMPSSVSTVSRAQITESKAKHLGELIESELGVTLGKYGSFGASNTASIRGSTSEQVLVLVDGRRINKIASGGAELSEIPLNCIERVEVVRGGASAIYGTNAIGGVINLITRKYSGDSPSVNLDVSAGSFNTRDISAGFNVKRNNVSTLVSAAKQQSSGWRGNSDYDAQNLFMRFGFDLGKSGQFDLTGTLFRNDYGAPGNAVDPATSSPLTVDKYDGSVELLASSPDARLKNSKDSARLEYQKKSGPGTLVTTVYVSDDKLKYIVPSWFMDARYDSLTLGGEIKYFYDSGFTFGAEWYEERYKQLDLTVDSVKIDKSRVNSAGFANYKFTTNRLTLIPSARFDSNSAFGSVFTPKLSVVYKAADSVKLSANAGKSWRSPTFNDLYWPRETNSFMGLTYITQGDEKIKPETAVSADAGIEYETEKYKTGLTVFNTEISDMINWQSLYDAATNTFTSMPLSVNNARQTGAEASVKHKINSYLAHELSYAYLWAVDTDLKTLLVYRPRNTARYAVSVMSGFGTRFTADVNYTGPQVTETNSAVTELPEYAVTNLKLSHKINDVQLWVKADNITGKQYQTRLGYPLPGTVYGAGVTIKFWD